MALHDCYKRCEKPYHQTNQAANVHTANLQNSEGLKNIADPLSECLTDEVETTVKDAIRCLPNILQKTITLRELGGYTYEEIAQVMKCPVGNIVG